MQILMNAELIPIYATLMQNVLMLQDRVQSGTILGSPKVFDKAESDPVKELMNVNVTKVTRAIKVINVKTLMNALNDLIILVVLTRLALTMLAVSAVFVTLVTLVM